MIRTFLAVFLVLFSSGPSVDLTLRTFFMRFRNIPASQKEIEYKKLIDNITKIGSLSPTKKLSYYLYYYLKIWVPILTFLRLLHIAFLHKIKSSSYSFSFFDPGYLLRNAIIEGDVKNVKYWLDKGINPNFRDQRIMTPFEYASGIINYVEYPQQRNGEWVTPIDVNNIPNPIKIGILLINAGASFDDAKTPVPIEHFFKMKKIYKAFDVYAIIPAVLDYAFYYWKVKPFEERNKLDDRYVMSSRAWSDRLNVFYNRCIEYKNQLNNNALN